MAVPQVEERVRAICTSFPGVEEKLSHGAPGYFAGRQFVMLWPRGHHDHHCPHLWCAAPAGVQEALVGTAPERFFRPPYVGGRGWLGVRLDSPPDGDPVEDDELRALCEDAYRTVAPKRLVMELDAGSGP